MSKTRAGIPTKTEYQKATNNTVFKELEEFSDSFVEKTTPLLKAYKKSWVHDPLHQWSRQWEYLYVFEEIQKFLQKNKNCKVLDLGSGITFLPFYLAQNNNLDMTCSDYDSRLSEQFKGVNKKLGTNVDFEEGDMRSLPFGEEEFDVVYCVSVLEHTDQYRQIIENISRIVKPNGIFVVTFDISLDGRDDIPLRDAEKLVDDLEKNFKSKYSTNPLHEQSLNPEIVTTTDMAKINKNLLPWDYPIINVFKPLMSGKGIGSRYKNLTFCCSTYLKT